MNRFFNCKLCKLSRLLIKRQCLNEETFINLHEQIFIYCCANIYFFKEDYKSIRYISDNILCIQFIIKALIY